MREIVSKVICCFRKHSMETSGRLIWTSFHTKGGDRANQRLTPLATAWHEQPVHVKIGFDGSVTSSSLETERAWDTGDILSRKSWCWHESVRTGITLRKWLNKRLLWKIIGTSWNSKEVTFLLIFMLYIDISFITYFWHAPVSSIFCGFKKYDIHIYANIIIKI